MCLWDDTLKFTDIVVITRSFSSGKVTNHKKNTNYHVIYSHFIVEKKLVIRGLNIRKG